MIESALRLRKRGGERGVTRQTALLTARIDLDGPACRYKTSTARIAAARMPAVIMRALNCPEDNSFALREPGRIFKALLPLGVNLLDTATAPSFFVPNSTEFSCSGRVSLRFLWLALLYPRRSPARHFRRVSVPFMKEINDICRTRPPSGHS